MAHHLNPSNYVDDGAAATRVTLVTAAGAATAAAAAVARTAAISRVATATTTTITAGKKAYTIAVVTAASAASPTIGGVAVPVGSYSWEAPPGDTLSALAVVTVSGDDVIISTLV